MTWLQLAVHQRSDGRPYVPITPWQAFELDARVGARLIAEHRGVVMTAELRRWEADGSLHVHVHAGIPLGADALRVRLPRCEP